jgi:magnesium transporter
MARIKTLGINAKAPSDNEIILELIQYNEQDYGMQADIPVDELLKQLKPGHVNWINVDGLHDKTIINSLGEHFALHPLLIEDLTSDQQPKAEEFDDYVFFTMKMLHSIKEGKIKYEQISFVLGKDYLLSFQETPGDFFGSFRERIKQGTGRIRKSRSDYLLYRLIDIIVDNYYTVFDEVGKQIETVEEDIYKKPTNQEFIQIQYIKKELIYLRKALYPLRDALSKLAKDESGFIEENNHRYFGDVHDHMVHLIDSLDTYKDLTSGLLDIHINTMNTRLNEVMKVLTMFSTIFMPLTFIVGIYGMNFEHMPEIHTFWGYPAVMIIMGITVFGMIRYFKYKKWF